MTMKKQLETIKDNWLLVAVVLILAIFMTNFGSIGKLSTTSYNKEYATDYAMAESAIYKGGVSADFAPEVEERIITKTASMSTKVDRGTYTDAELKLKSIIKTSDGFILNENVNENGEGRTAYTQGWYSIKVETGKYDAILNQLKDIGEITSFNENARDETGQYVNLQEQLTLEKERLKRYNQMYTEAKEIEDKIQLNDRIFNQERTIKYLENAIENIDKRVDYSTISISMVEEQSGYAGIAISKFSALIRNLVNSVNSLLSLIFWIAPWAIVFLIGKWIYKRFK